MFFGERDVHRKKVHQRKKYISKLKRSLSNVCYVMILNVHCFWRFYVCVCVSLLLILNLFDVFPDSTRIVLGTEEGLHVVDLSKDRKYSQGFVVEAFML